MRKEEKEEQKPKKMQRTFKKRNDFNSSMPNLMATKMSWSLMATIVMMVLQQQIKTTDAVKFKGDSCISKNQPGICKEWGECPIIKTLIESGQYSNREVVSCGFGIREELICCPVVKTNTNTNTGTSETGTTDSFVIPTTTTKTLARDFWLDLLENTTTTTAAIPTTTTTTTAQRDFWLDLLTSTTTTLKPTIATLTTTIKPLIVGDQRLNESSEFFDLNALLSSKHTGGSKQERQVTTVASITNHNNNNRGFVHPGNNGIGRGKLKSGPLNLNQWIFDNAGNHGNNNNNNFRGNGNNGRGQGNVWAENNGRGQGNGWGQNNGRGQGNNGRGRPGMGNQNRGFVFPDSNKRPNNQLFENDVSSSRRPGTAVNTMTVQNQFPDNPSLQPSSSQRPSTTPQNSDSKQEEERIENLIKNVFDTSFNNNNNNNNNENSIADPITTQGKTLEPSVEETIANVFNLKPQQNTPQQPKNTHNSKQFVAPSNNQPVVWLSPEDTIKNPVEYIQLPLPQPPQPPQQVAFQNPHTTGHFEIIPAVEHHMNSNQMGVAPSTSFIQQPVVVETWPNNPMQHNKFDPVQVVFQNLANSGMDIVKANEMHNQEQVVVVQPQISNPQHFVQPLPSQHHQQQVFFQQPQHLIQQPLQQLIEQPQQQQQPQQPQQQQSESLMKEPRSTVLLPNIQSPPAQVLDPFKPFEFRPPPAEAFSEDNNSLSPNPTLTARDANSSERPAVRACSRIERGLTASLSPHILGGTPAELGEFPHMVALGYSRIGGDNRPPYDIRCGGTLIDKRFVLTAAHCVSDRESVPTIVRLGVVNFTDPDQMSQAVELRIKQTYIHDEYSTRLTYNDIAILELERDVETSEYIYPVCLYTNETDPDTETKLWVTGWGTVNTTTRSFSDILLKAPLYTSPLDHCNRSFNEYGLNRRIPDGIIRTQFCAEDKGQVKDACQGDSGGPLHLIVDESLKNYRLVGIVSSGFGCASSTPGLYTRVAAFLDFIEKIVWPNGGD